LLAGNTSGPAFGPGDRFHLKKSQTSFYDGEGMKGVGAFGYFDASTRQYTLFSLREVAAWETSALLVEKDVVWLGLDRFGEDISTSPGGLVRWDRTTHEARHYAFEFVINRIRREGDSLRFPTRTATPSSVMAKFIDIPRAESR
jgi:hypothetical protein